MSSDDYREDYETYIKMYGKARDPGRPWKDTFITAAMVRDQKAAEKKFHYNRRKAMIMQYTRVPAPKETKAQRDYEEAYVARLNAKRRNARIARAQALQTVYQMNRKKAIKKKEKKISKLHKAAAEKFILPLQRKKKKNC